MNLKLLSRIKTRDAAVVFEFLFERLNRQAGSIDGASCEGIAVELNRAGIQTARGAAFTARVVRAKLEELEELEVVERADAAAASFTLFVFMPYPCAPKEAPEPEPAVDHYGGRSLFDALKDGAEEPAQNGNENGNQFGNENGNENGNGRAINKEYINTNKKINKADLDLEKAKETEPPIDDRPSTSEIRTRVDFSEPRAAKLREAVCRDMWESTTNPDLVDRAAAAILLKVGDTTAREIKAIVREAKDAVALYERTDGRAGRSKIWQTVCYRVKRIYESNGWKWTRTGIGAEPRPKDPEAEARRRVLARLNE